MKQINGPKLLGFLLLAFIFSSCVSNKKHKQAITALKTSHTAEVNQWQNQLHNAQAEITELNLQLAERKGENNILVDLRQELQDQIADLESQIENIGSKSASTQESLSAELQQKEREIKALKGQLTNVEKILDQQKTQMNQLLGELNLPLQNYNQNEVTVTSDFQQVKVILTEDFLFQKRSTTRLTNEGMAVLEKIVEILKRHPNLEFVVIGHTDNSQPNQAFKDNWNFSVLEAATVVQYLTDELDITANQVMAAGKGEFAPRTSNSTSEGKSANRRIELLIAPKQEDLAKAIRKAIAP